MKLCIVIPALNEEATITDILNRIPRDIPGISSIETIVIDDGSRDRTRELALQKGAVVVSHDRNMGVGSALQTGIQTSLERNADFMVNMDGDGQFSPEDIPKLVQPLVSGDAEFVTASRFLNRDYYPQMDMFRFYGNRLMSALISLLTGRKFFDVSCGFRGYTRNVLRHLNLFGQFTYTQESFLELSYKGIAIIEIPLRIQGTRQHGHSRIARNLLKYAYRTSKIIFRSFRDYRPLIVFGFLAGALFVLSAGLTVFLLCHYAQTGSFFPHKWAGFVAGYSFGIGILIFVSGLVADMLTRIRMNQERILYLLRRKEQ